VSGPRINPTGESIYVQGVKLTVSFA
jgi:hypothetical protein